MVQRVIQYRTADGKIYEDEVEAVKHELLGEFTNRIKLVIAASVSTLRPESIAAEIIIEADAILDILQSYKKRLPKYKAPKPSAIQLEEKPIELKAAA